MAPSPPAWLTVTERKSEPNTSHFRSMFEPPKQRLRSGRMSKSMGITSPRSRREAPLPACGGTGLKARGKNRVGGLSPTDVKKPESAAVGPLPPCLAHGHREKE